MTFFEIVYKELTHSEFAYLCVCSPVFKLAYSDRIMRNKIRHFSRLFLFYYNSYNSPKLKFGDCTYLFELEDTKKKTSWESRYYIPRLIRIEFLKYCIQNNFYI